MKDAEIPRIRIPPEGADPCAGHVIWSPVKSAWFVGHLAAAVIGFKYCWNLNVAAASLAFTAFTLCCGHSLGLHRLLVHRSFECPWWLEWLLVHFGVVVGMGGPHRILYMHDIRDWSQRHESCHSYFSNQGPIWRDFLRQMFCEIRLERAPRFVLEPRVENSQIHLLMQRTWMLQQVPWAALFYVLGGWGMVIGCISVRITASLLGHWLVGYLAHNVGSRDWLVRGHAVQGYNVPWLSLLTMGESWHNNHHAFPGSARLGLCAAQFDPAWWVLCALRRVGLAWNVQLPENLPLRSEVVRISRPLTGIRGLAVTQQALEAKLPVH